MNKIVTWFKQKEKKLKRWNKLRVLNNAVDREYQKGPMNSRWAFDSLIGSITSSMEFNGSQSAGLHYVHEFILEVTGELVRNLQFLAPLCTKAPLSGVQPMQGPVGMGYVMNYGLDEHGRRTMEIVSRAIEAKSRCLNVNTPCGIAAHSDVKTRRVLIQQTANSILQDFAAELSVNLYDVSRAEDLSHTALEDLISMDIRDIEPDQRRILVNKKGLEFLAGSQLLVDLPVCQSELVPLVGKFNGTHEVFLASALDKYDKAIVIANYSQLFCPYMLVVYAGSVCNEDGEYSERFISRFGSHSAADDVCRVFHAE